MRAAWHKNILLAKVFCHNDPEAEMERKKQRFHDFIGRFRLESFRRDTKIVTEGSKNEKLYIIARGEARLIKQLAAGEISKPCHMKSCASKGEVDVDKGSSWP